MQVETTQVQSIQLTLLKLNVRERSWLIGLSHDWLTTPRHLVTSYSCDLKDAQAAFKKFRELGLVTYETRHDENGRLKGRAYALSPFGLNVKDALIELTVNTKLANTKTNFWKSWTLKLFRK